MHKLFEFEDSNNLFQLQTADGIKYWDLVRYHVHSYVLSQEGVLPPYPLVSEKPQNSFSNKLKTTLYLLPFVIYNRLRRTKPRSRYLIVLNSRNKIQDGYEDLLMQDIYENLDESPVALEVFTLSRFEVFKKFAKRKKFLFEVELLRVLKKVSYGDFGHINQLIEKEFGVSFDFSPLINQAVHEYRCAYPYYKKLLVKKKVRAVFLQSYPKALIAAANDLGIETFDFQHGHLNDFDPYYSYPKGFETKSVPSIVKNYLTIGAFWNSVIHPSIRTSAIGSTYFFPDKAIQSRDFVLVVSNQFIHDDLIRDLITLAEAYPEETFVYKMHSNQDRQIKNTEDLTKNFKNIVIHNNLDINELLIRSKLVVLVQSTVAYQALQLGVPVGIVAKYYFEASEDLFNLKGVILEDSLLNILNKFMAGETLPEVEKMNFFEKFKPEAFKNLLLQFAEK